jgi:glutamyl-tRNA reductase
MQVRESNIIEKYLQIPVIEGYFKDFDFLKTLILMFGKYPRLNYIINMKLIMTGLDYKRSNLSVREKFAVTTAKAVKMLADFKNGGIGIDGCVILSTCNRMELYASIRDDGDLALSTVLYSALGIDFSEYESHLTERAGDRVIEHLCRVASGLDSQIIGDDQIITQVREALELSRERHCTDSCIETLFNLSIHAAKAIKTKVFINTLRTNSVPEKTVEKIKTMRRHPLSSQKALVIGSGRIGRQICDLLIREGADVTVTLRSHNMGGNARINDKANVIDYDERYRTLENMDIVISATTSPHITISKDELTALKRIPEIIVDLAVPRDVEASVRTINGVTLLTIDDISDGGQRLPPENVSMTERIIAEHIEKYNKWLLHRMTNKNTLFPLFVDMNGKKVLIVGGGNVAERRIKTLAPFGANITVISPNITEYIERASSSNLIHLLRRRYENMDISAINPFLVIAATDDRQVNHNITAEAKSRNIHVSVADCRDDCTFYFPAIAENENCIAGLVSKNGDHAGVKVSARKIREVLNP